MFSNCPTNLFSLNSLDQYMVTFFFSILFFCEVTPRALRKGLFSASASLIGGDERGRCWLVLHHFFSIGTPLRMYVLRPLYTAQTIWAGSCVDMFTLGLKQREKTSVATRTGDSYFFVIFSVFFLLFLLLQRLQRHGWSYRKSVLSPLLCFLVDRNAELNHNIQNLSWSCISY